MNRASDRLDRTCQRLARASQRLNRASQRLGRTSRRLGRAYLSWPGLMRQAEGVGADGCLDGRTNTQIPPVFYRTLSPLEPQPKKKKKTKKTNGEVKKNVATHSGDEIDTFNPNIQTSFP